MTKRTATAAIKGIKNATITGRGQDWEIECRTQKAKREVRKAIPGLGGFRTGYGSWCLYQNYESPGDWNDASSRCHY